ncbi:hypothetical protein BDN72DRAFT_900841 [Pluteus cervinus]|uniref:Uncharacterized protein n=1 Tax=Pluteus cervinus TaxID=181527 RepID=A0ACD3AJ92_9AGAR|nr:hypothetical protein BDN72DRAFT_900841 [Pluteus cervinus]
MGTECTEILLLGLRALTRKPDLNMQYKKYHKLIVGPEGVALVGWPKGVPFKTPTKITSTELVRELRDALRQKKCHWAWQSRSERDEWEAEHSVSAGTVRKKRSDAGTAGVRQPYKKRTKVAEDMEDESDGNDGEGVSSGSRSRGRGGRGGGRGGRGGPSGRGIRGIRGGRGGRGRGGSAIGKVPPTYKSKAIVDDSDDSHESDSD